MNVEISWNSGHFFVSYECGEPNTKKKKKKSKLELVYFIKVPVYFEFITTKKREIWRMENCYN